MGMRKVIAAQAVCFFRRHDDIEPVAGDVAAQSRFEAGNDRAVAEQDRQRLAAMRRIDLGSALVGQQVMKRHDFVFFRLHGPLRSGPRMVQGHGAGVI